MSLPTRPPPGYMTLAEAMALPRTSPLVYSEYTKSVADKFIRDNLPTMMHETLNRLTKEMHYKIKSAAIAIHTIGWAFDHTGQNLGIKNLTVDNVKKDLIKIYTMYYNVYTMSLMPKGEIRDQYDPEKNFKNRMKIVTRNMYGDTCLDGNTRESRFQNKVIIP